MFSVKQRFIVRQNVKTLYFQLPQENTGTISSFYEKSFPLIVTLRAN